MNTPNEYVQNPDVIKAMLVPSKISTPKSAVGGDDDDEDQDDTGFQDASYLTPISRESFLQTPRIRTQRKKISSDLRKSIKGWQALKK